MEVSQMENKLTLKVVHQKLKRFGFNQKYINTILMPNWWDPKLNNSQPAVLECCAIICNRTGLNLESLLDPDKQLFFSHDV